MNKFAKMLLVTTSFSPILLTYCFVIFIKNGFNIELFTYLFIVSMLVLICFLLLKHANNQFERERFSITSIKTADGEVLGFIVAYLIPILSITNPQIDDRVMVFIICIFYIVIWTTNSYHINPLLTLVGYHFYEVTTKDNVTYLLLTRKDLKKTSEVCKIVHLTEYMILDVEE